MEPDESLLDAAVRELFEETGMIIETQALGDPFAEHEHRFGWDGLVLVQHETYFAARSSGAAISFRGMEQIELDTIDRADWWTPEGLDADGPRAFLS